MAFYFWNMVVPAALVNTMSILVFLLPPESNEKISLGITVMLALSVNMMAIRDYVPANSLQTPIIRDYHRLIITKKQFKLGRYKLKCSSFQETFKKIFLLERIFQGIFSLYKNLSKNFFSLKESFKEFFPCKILAR